MSGEQKIRAVLFYLSVAIFFLGLPPILSFTLGYKFDRRTFKFTKTGLIAIKTQPAGANIYLDNRLFPSKTPATINELLPGKYHLKFELDKYYPWSNEVEVQAGKVTRLEKIILFPTLSNIKQLNRDNLSLFLLDEERQVLYCINSEEGIIFRSDTEGERFEVVSNFSALSPAPAKWKISPDREKFLYFNINQIGIAFLHPLNGKLSAPASFVSGLPEAKIVDVFWHSDSYHLIVVTNRSIEVTEAQPRSTPITLVNLNKKNTAAHYDPHTDTLYFLDAQRAPDGNLYDNLYKLELNTRNFLFQELMRLKSYE